MAASQRKRFTKICSNLSGNERCNLQGDDDGFKGYSPLTNALLLSVFGESGNPLVHQAGARLVDANEQ